MTEHEGPDIFPWDMDTRSYPTDDDVSETIDRIRDRMKENSGGELPQHLLDLMSSPGFIEFVRKAKGEFPKRKQEFEFSEVEGPRFGEMLNELLSSPHAFVDDLKVKHLDTPGDHASNDTLKQQLLWERGHPGS